MTAKKLKDIVESGIIKKITDILGKKNISYSIHDKIQLNPIYVMATDAVKYAKENNCDMLIAVGGGSSINMVKSEGIILILS